MPPITTLSQLISQWNALSLGDRYMIMKLLQVADGRNVQLGRTTGTMFGTAHDQKMAFWGKTPIVQPGAISNPSGGTIIDIQSRSAISSILTLLTNEGLMG